MLVKEFELDADAVAVNSGENWRELFDAHAEKMSHRSFNRYSLGIFHGGSVSATTYVFNTLVAREPEKDDHPANQILNYRVVSVEEADELSALSIHRTPPKRQ